MTIRSYRTSDLADCRALWAELVQRHRDIYEDQSIGGDDPGREFDKHLEGIGEDAVWVAEVEGGLAGFTSLIVKDREAEIEPVVVSECSAVPLVLLKRHLAYHHVAQGEAAGEPWMVSL